MRGPSGRRCYTPERAGELAGFTARWAKKLTSVERETEDGGHRRVFLDAESFEDYLVERGIQQGDSGSLATVHPIADRLPTDGASPERREENLMGALEELRDEHDASQAEVAHLTVQLANARAEVKALNRVVAEYTKMLGRRLH